jgi:hypothetical protein
VDEILDADDTELAQHLDRERDAVRIPLPMLTALMLLPDNGNKAEDLRNFQVAAWTYLAEGFR